MDRAINLIVEQFLREGKLIPIPGVSSAYFWVISLVWRDII